MKRLWVAALFLPLASHAIAQTDHGRIRSPGVQADTFNNTATVVLTGANPSIAGGNVFKTNNGSPTTVTNFTGGVDTKRIVLTCGETNTTIQNNANISLTGGVNFTCVLNQSIELVYNAASAVWSQVGGNGSGGGGSSSGTAGHVQVSSGGGGFNAGSIIDDASTVVIPLPTTVRADATFYGPNPNFDMRAFGAYASTSTPPSTTGSITTGTTTLTVADGTTFLNGHGLVIYKAGANPAITTPGQPSVTPINLTGGATTYNYKVVAMERNGALTAAGSTGTTTIGAATLGLNTITLTNCTRVNGVATYTASGTHNIAVGTQLNISGFVQTSLCGGVKAVATVPTGTTFTTNDGNTLDENTNGSSPIAQVYACNKLDFPSSSYSGDSTIEYFFYRNNVLAGAASGIDPFYLDCGLAAPTVPSYVPSSPPGATQPGYLATTIVSGGGTTTLTLANSASTTASSQTVLHDNSLALKACSAAAIASPGGTCFVPNVGSNVFVFNATTDLTTLSSLSAFKIHLASTIYLNQPLIPRRNMELEGEAKDQTSFGYLPMVKILGTGYPLVFGAYTTTSFHMKQLMIVALNSQQVGFLADAAPNNGGPVGVISDDVFYIGDSSRNWPVILKAGFDYRFKGGGVSNGSGATVFSPTAGMLFTGPSAAVVGNSGTSQLPGIVKLEDVFFNGKGIVFDCTPKDQNFFVSTYDISGSLYEALTAPFLRATCRGAGGAGGGFITSLHFSKIVLADQLVGIGTPVIDSQGSAMGNVVWQNGTGIGGPLLIGSNSTSTVIDAVSVSTGNGATMGIAGANLATNGIITASGSGYIGATMPAAVAPGVVVSAGGSVPTAAVGYAVQYQDANGAWGPFSKTTIITPTGGNQTVTITPTPPVGAVNMRVGRTGGGGPNSQDFQFIALTVGGCGGFSHPANTIVVDSTSFTCGTITDIGVSTSASVSASGLAGPSLKLINGGFTATHDFPNNLTANRTQSIPDVTGYVPVSSYLNGAYDNATRANGAIGSNWVVTNNGINVASNNFVGTTTQQNAAYWNANPFSPSQYSQMTMTALNGTTDFPGVTVLMSGSGGATHGYVCLMSTTAMDLKRISGTGQTSLTSAGNTGAVGDVLRLEAGPGGLLTCYKNGVAILATTDVTYTSGQPGLFTIGTVATFKNWSGGNLHPLTHLDLEQDWTKTQHLVQGIALGGSTESFNTNPRFTPPIFLPGALTTTWTGASWTIDKAIIVTRVQSAAKIAPSGCGTNAIVRLTDGATPVNLTLTGATNDSGAISQSYAAGATLTVSVQTAASGCTASPGDVNVVLQSRLP